VDWRSKLGIPEKLVLYRTPDRWRFAIYGDTGNVADGYLDTSIGTDVEEAQGALVSRASDIAQISLTVSWHTSQPGWWTGDVTVR
jgi:hypothetical protein